MPEHTITPPSRGGQRNSEGIHGPPLSEGCRPSLAIRAPALANRVCARGGIGGVL
jgi:hypothetical protein